MNHITLNQNDHERVTKIINFVHEFSHLGAEIDNDGNLLLKGSISSDFKNIYGNKYFERLAEKINESIRSILVEIEQDVDSELRILTDNGR